MATRPVVVDASAVAGWLLPDEGGADLTTLIESAADLIAPHLFWAEMRNIFVVAERRGRVDPVETDRILEALDRLGLEFDVSPSSAAVTGLARRHRLTVYDALSLELALRRGARLASLDAALIRAAQSEGVQTV